MSAYPGISGAGNGMQSLLDQLRQSKQNKPINLEPASTYGYVNAANSNSNPNSNSNSNMLPGYFAPPQQQYSGSPTYHQPSIQSVAPTPPAYNNTQPHHASAVMSPSDTHPGHGNPHSNMGGRVSSAQNPDRTSSLLGLLKFSNNTAPSPASPRQPAPIGTPLPPSREPSMGFPRSEIAGQFSTQDPGRSGTDLLATLMGSIQSHSPQIVRASPQPAAAPKSAPFSSSVNPTSPPAETQNYLLSLLNKPKPAPLDTTPQIIPANVFTQPPKEEIFEEVEPDIEEVTQALQDSVLDLATMTVAAEKENLTVSSTTSNKAPVSEVATKATQGLFTYVNPFDQLSASSPLARTPKNTTPAPSAAPAIQILKRSTVDLNQSDNKRKIDQSGSSSSHGPVSSKRKLQDTPDLSSGPPTPLPDGRTKVEALLGIGAPGRKESGSKESVAEAMDELSGQVDKQVQEAIALAENEENQAAIKKEFEDMMTAEGNEDFEDSAQVLAQHIRAELAKEENRHALDILPTSEAEEVAAIVDAVADGHVADIDEIADGNVVDSWESADAEEPSAETEKDELVVKVYNFPMRPWTSITIRGNEGTDSLPSFRSSVIMDIARLKKDFDQVDRNLVTGSNHYIVYGMSNKGGIRIIRQEDGVDGKIFTETNDRIFNVVTSVSTADLKESIIGTGISGTVYWALVKDGEGDNLEDGELELHGFALPPIQTLDGDTPGGGVLKTRARKSSSHPEYFAIGRGKFIHIIWPKIILKSYLKHGKDRTADIEKYLQQNTFKINTGKAGKDFVFSEDDTVVASLDKAGRVKFWDIRPLIKTDGRGSPSPLNSSPVEVKEPLCTLTTTPATEKAWPTSVLFVDKARPYQKGGALRYAIVGMKQNHSFQLWDLGLQKAVQEIHLPHSKESDAVCSVLYHPATGIIVIGHPTRNSIYFLHLSAPKYNLSKAVTQAEYMQMVAEEDSALPKPDSTAVISGMREYSFANRGQLRSLDMLATPSSSNAKDDPATLFELYAMHSKGVTCISIKQEDLGWTEENKVKNPVAAEPAGIIDITSLKEVVSPPVDEPITPQSLPIRTTPRPVSKDVKETPKKSRAEASSSTPAAKGEEKSEKKEAAGNGERSAKSKRGSRKHISTSEIQASSSTPSASQPSRPIVLDPNSHSRNGGFARTAFTDVGNQNQIKTNIPASHIEDTRNGPRSTPIGVNTPQTSLSFPSPPASGISEATIKEIESRVSEEVKKVLKSSLATLSDDIKTDRRTQTVVSNSNHEALLRMVSVTLADNVEQHLSRIITAGIQDSVLPAISTVTMKAITGQVQEQLGSKLTEKVTASIPKDLQKLLPDAIGKVLQQPQILKLMSESLARGVAFKVEEQFAVLMHNTVVPAFTNMAVQTAEKLASDVQRQAAAQIATIKQEHRQQRDADNDKIDKLMQLVTGLTQTVSTMAAAQTDFQAQFLKLQESVTGGSKYREQITRQSQSTASSSREVSLSVEQSEEERQLAVIKIHMDDQNYSDAVLAWLQSGHVQQLFKRYFAHYRPEFLRDMNTIMLLSVGAQICETIEDEFMTQRVAYLDMIIQVLHSQVMDGNLVSITIKISRLNQLTHHAGRSCHCSYPLDCWNFYFQT
jgi:hypothetical protein